jgi:hypothetical protein
VWKQWAWLGVVVTLAACPPPETPAAPIPPVSTGKVRVRVFTEPAPVKVVAAVGKFVFIATDDELQRWDDTGTVLSMTADHGLSGSHIVAVTPDAERKQLWILTDGGFGHYDATTEVYSELSPAPASMALDYAVIAKDGVASLAPATESGVWLGTTKGLVFVSDKGGWMPTPIKEPIHALVRDRAGWLWMATKAGLLVRKPSGDVVKIGAAQGCAVVAPRLVVEASDDRVLAIGVDGQGHERIAIGKQMVWTSYRALPEVTWSAVARRGTGVVVMGGGHVYRIGPPGAAVRPLARDGVRLVSLASGSEGDWVMDPLDVELPSSATTLAAVDDQLLVGTSDLGTARYRPREPRPHDWLRRKQMFEDATTLSVACVRAADCWIATGARQGWHWVGDRFIAGGPDQEVVLAVVRDPAGPIYAIHRTPQDHELRLSRIEGATWTLVEHVTLTTPGDKPEVSFARFSGSGTLWVGLRYHDGEERRPYGIAIIEPASGKVTYHRTEASHDKTKKMLPIPVGVVDADLRGETAWFATNEGVARLTGGQVKLWTEADGLRSELARAVTVAGDVGVIVATGAGAGVWDGKTWDFPATLRFEINDLVATHNGQVWMATERGIAAWDGKKVRRVDTRRGLAEDEVRDVAADQYDRVWARGPGSLTLISQ